MLAMLSRCVPRDTEAADAADDANVKTVTNKDGTLGVVELQELLEKAGVQCHLARRQGLLTFLGGKDGVVQQDEFEGALEDLRKFLDTATAETKMVSDITGIPSMGQYKKDMAEVPTGRLVCVYGIDMANLKVLNDSKGHDKADVVLKWYAEELTNVVKSADSSELVEKAFAYHMHGDEFCAVLVAAESAGAADFAAYARDKLLLPIAAIHYKKEGYPESYMRAGALCSVDATYEKADTLQELVGKKLKLAYPDRSKVCTGPRVGGESCTAQRGLNSLFDGAPRCARSMAASTTRS